METTSMETALYWLRETLQVVLLCTVVLLPVIAVYLFFLCGTFLEEGTGKLVLKLGAYHKTLIAKIGFATNERGTVVSGQERHLLGGWRWVGLWPFFRVFKKKKFRWIKPKPDGTLEEKEEENVEKLLLRFYVYGMKSEDAEDKNLVPVNSSWSITAWTNNLKKAWLDTEDWFGTFRSRVLPYIRHHVSLHTYQEIIENPDVRLDKLVEATLRDEGIIDELRKRHGIHVVAIECIGISPDEKFRKSTLKIWEAEREAEAELKKQEIGTTSFALQTSGREIAMISRWIGIPIKNLQTELLAAINADPESGFEKWLKRFPVIQKNWNLIQQQLLGVKPQLFGNVDGTPLDPLTSAFATLISLSKSVGGSSGGGGSEKSDGGKTVSDSSEKKKKGGIRKIEDMDPEELEDEAARVVREVEIEKKKP